MVEKDIILSRWLEGEISDEEVRSRLGDIDLDHLKNTLHLQKDFRLPSTDLESSWEGFLARRDSDLEKSPAKRRGRWLIFGSVILLLASLIGYWLITDRHQVVKTPPEEFLLYAFEDGSTAKLWPGSSLSYDASKYNEERKVRLQGQAFFEVEKGTTFEVSTSSGKVMVLGTSFDVWSIDDQNMDVRCHSGSVAVRDKKGREEILTPGQRVMISEDKIGQLKKYNVDNQDDDLKYYDQALVSWVISDLKTLYGVRVEVDKELTQERFTGVISTKNLGQALSYLCETMRWHCDQNKKSIVISDQD